MASSDDSEETPECRVCLEDLRLRQLETGIHTTLSSAPVFSDRTPFRKGYREGEEDLFKKVIAGGLFQRTDSS